MGDFKIKYSKCEAIVREIHSNNTFLQEIQENLASAKKELEEVSK